MKQTTKYPKLQWHLQAVFGYGCVALWLMIWGAFIWATSREHWLFGCIAVAMFTVATAGAWLKLLEEDAKGGGQ